MGKDWKFMKDDRWVVYISDDRKYFGIGPILSNMIFYNRIYTNQEWNESGEYMLGTNHKILKNKQYAFKLLFLYGFDVNNT